MAKATVTVTKMSDFFEYQSKKEYLADPKNQVQRDFAARTAWRNNEFICYHGGKLNEGCERIEFSAHQKDDGTKVINVDFDTNCREVACMRLSIAQVRELQSALTKLIMNKDNCKTAEKQEVKDEHSLQYHYPPNEPVIIIK